MRVQSIGVASRISVFAALMLPGCCGKQGSESAAVPAAGAAGWVAAAQASPAKKIGVLDAADCQSIRGWAWDPKRPDEPLKVDIYDGEKLITTLTADQYRTDLEDLGLGNGKHEFEMIPPSALSDGTAHAIHARFSGTTYDLNISPRTLICSEEEAESPSPAPSEHETKAAPTVP
jgi:hypothetical protein